MYIELFNINYEGMILVQFKEVSSSNLRINPSRTFRDRWFLLAAGDKDNYNMMTVSWGSLGVMWGKDVFTAVVRPSRHTYKFMENSDYFTASIFPEEYRDQLTFCGRNSGRDVDKTAETGFTPIFNNDGIIFDESELAFICRKIYITDIVPEGFVGMNYEEAYPSGDLHRAYIGEIVSVLKRDDSKF